MILLLLNGWLYLTNSLLAHPPVPTTPAMSTLRIEITDLRSNNGQVLLSLFNSGDGFPSGAEKAFKTAAESIRNQTCTLVIENVPPGEYAISFIHDENGNGKMDTNALGIPKEGYGASNNAKASLGPPKYADAKFNVPDGKASHTMKARYF